jgi:hypothetical protein
VTDRASLPRKRGWPVASQIGLAVVLGLVVATAIGVVANRHGSTRTKTATSAGSPATTTGTRAPNSGLLALRIAAPSHRDEYSRTADFGGWLDVRGCQNTRATLLLRTSQAPVTFTTVRNCTVKAGRWVDPWSGSVATDARDFQIDHTVPLGNAWRSGAWSWTHDRRVGYANDLADSDHLVPILAHENESKSDDGPESWRPPSRSAWCRYALAWDHIKAKWELSATTAEWSALQTMSATC